MSFAVLIDLEISKMCVKASDRQMRRVNCGGDSAVDGGGVSLSIVVEDSSGEGCSVEVDVAVAVAAGWLVVAGAELPLFPRLETMVDGSLQC
mmetsp:Transcript_5219/g.7727  ORF Transcript_5219/g.7727 Transcript_5219/m.7727 type:complete len:92 (+) Transcript_5219:124-399(+)|eukprot:CAMPEP_0203635086 /NCGR_PEP_ID=MMETSP0088-20131115/1945_1 /ASSEMBLY_ACC=CAM_ASM_001087 /TAXON_ID=426623 /ORGANISM="Chaetoceros affinis, Strain CCMP159" /LENGTH=91 /DNA_ID=CAMNT_0050488863 /DNA_START=35 /DNA_END=310 /DNA_ORIENTATION=-